MQGVLRVATVAIGLSCSGIGASARDLARLVQGPQKNHLKIDWGVSGRKGLRQHMEDAYAVKVSHEQHLFSLYDGHGGLEAAYTAAGSLPTYIFAQGEEKGFRSVHEMLKQSGCTSGTTAVTARVIPQSSGAYQLVIAWVGDSRAVLANDQGFMQLATVDHKPENELEKERVEAVGGKVYKQIYRSCNGTKRSILRVAFPADTGGKHKGGLSLTRALGDAAWPDAIISRDPQMLSYILQPGVDECLILACDGVWDKISSPAASQYAYCVYNDVQKLPEEKISQLLSDQTAIEKDQERTHEEGTSAQAILTARTLRDMAYKFGSSDNITAMVIKFTWEDGDSPEPESLCSIL